MVVKHADDRTRGVGRRRQQIISRHICHYYEEESSIEILFGTRFCLAIGDLSHPPREHLNLRQPES